MTNEQQLLRPLPTRPWRVYRTGTEHLTILEAHPWHTPQGRIAHRGAGCYEQSYEPHCPLCRQEALPLRKETAYDDAD